MATVKTRQDVAAAAAELHAAIAAFHEARQEAGAGEETGGAEGTTLEGEDPPDEPNAGAGQELEEDPAGATENPGNEQDTEEDGGSAEEPGAPEEDPENQPQDEGEFGEEGDLNHQ
jgi:hypothetical protein